MTRTEQVARDIRDPSFPAVDKIEVAALLDRLSRIEAAVLPANIDSIAARAKEWTRRCVADLGNPVVRAELLVAVADREALLGALLVLTAELETERGYRRCMQAGSEEHGRERDTARAEVARLTKELADLREVDQATCKDVARTAAERDQARLACVVNAGDWRTAGAACGQRDDEYPLKAVLRVVAERDTARAEVERLTRERDLAFVRGESHQLDQLTKIGGFECWPGMAPLAEAWRERETLQKTLATEKARADRLAAELETERAGHGQPADGYRARNEGPPVGPGCEAGCKVFSDGWQHRVECKRG